MAKRDKIRRTIQKVQRLAVYRRDGYVCGYCEVPKKRKPSSLAVDHIIPVRYGGYHGMENWVAACRICNGNKWLHAPREKGAPKLVWHAGKKVAKLTWLAKGKRFPARIPKISYKSVL